MIQENSGNIKEIIANARNITANTQSITQHVTDLFDDEFHQNLQRSMAALPGTIDSFNTTMAEMKDKVSVTVDNINTTVTHLDKTMVEVSGKLNTAVDSANQLIGDVQKMTGPIVQNLPNWAGNINRILQNLDVVTTRMQDKNSTLGMLLTDRRLYDDLSLSVGKVTSLIRQAEPILFNAQVFSEKIARHPELLGVRGALKPSSGTTTLSSSIPWPSGI